MPETVITVEGKSKQTTIRLTEKTKRMLESHSSGKMTHEAILLDLIKTVNAFNAAGGTQILNKNNVQGIKYERMHSTQSIKILKQNYEVVCTYNDLRIFDIIKKASPAAQLILHQTTQALFPKSEQNWELNLELVNIQRKNGKWEDPAILKKEDYKEYLLLYLVTVKWALEEIFSIDMYELTTTEDFLDIFKWEKAYKRNDLSLESLRVDVEKKLSAL